jgi:hypothetical protein
MAVCILKLKTLQMSCHVRRYTTLGMYKDSVFWDKIPCRLGG